MRTGGRSIWLTELNRPELASAVDDWIEKVLVAAQILPQPYALKDHMYDRFLPLQSTATRHG